MTRASDTARLVSGGAVLNEASNDVDFRVESDGNANMFIVDGGQNKVGIGVSPAKGMLHIQPSARTTNFSASDHTTYADIYVHNPTDDDTCATGIAFATDASSFDNGASGIACISGTGDSESSLAFITRPNGAVAAEAMRINSSQNVGIGTTSPSTPLHVVGNNGILIDENGSGDGQLYFGGISGSDRSYIARNGDDLLIWNVANGTERFGTNDTERMRIDGSGHILLGGKTSIPTTEGGTGFDPDTNGRMTLHIGSSATGLQSLIFFNNGNGLVGTIQVNGSSTAFNTSSDYRLKENVVTDWDATTRLKQLKPSRFNFKTDKATTMDGFLAHEVSSIVPEAISGEKDAVDADGNIEPQGIDQSKLVPLMVKTIQELEARIATLESK